MNFDAFGFFSLCLAFVFFKPVMNSSDADRAWLNRMIDSMEEESKPQRSLYPAGRPWRGDPNLSPAKTALDRIIQKPDSLQDRTGTLDKRFGVNLLCCNVPPTREPYKKRTQEYSLNGLTDENKLKFLLMAKMLRSENQGAYPESYNNIPSWPGNRKRQSPDDLFYLKRRRVEASPGGLSTINDG